MVLMISTEEVDRMRRLTVRGSSSALNGFSSSRLRNIAALFLDIARLIELHRSRANNAKSHAFESQVLQDIDKIAENILKTSEGAAPSKGCLEHVHTIRECARAIQHACGKHLQTTLPGVL